MSLDLKNYKNILTQDGSQTLFSERYQEACHSLTGAVKETQLHYITGCEVIRRRVGSILEVGFGTGIGLQESLAAIQWPCQFLSFEIDPALARYSLDQLQISYQKSGEDFIGSVGDFSFQIFIGDARERIHDINIKAQAIYQDAFSPKKNADLWTIEWFEALKNTASSDCILSTYSASSSIRKAMIQAGWKLYEGEKFGPKRSSTRAKLSGETTPTILERLNRSPAITLSDANYKDYSK